MTGGGGLVGSAIARGLADAGARVVLAGRDRAALDGAAAEARAAGTLELDVADERSVGTAFAKLDEEHGGLDILVNNAGIASAAQMGNVTRADFEQVFAVNVIGLYLCAQRAADLMRARGGGKIVNVGSIYGSVSPDRRIYEETPEMVQASPVYIASKSALVNLTRDLAVQLAPSNIQVNLLSPGGVEAGQEEPFKDRYSGRTPAGRMARPADLAGTAVYLSSAASDYVTGQNILVDGGLTAW